MGVITNMRSQMQVVMWTILVLFVTSMAIGGLVCGASITDIFGQISDGQSLITVIFNQSGYLAGISFEGTYISQKK